MYDEPRSPPRIPLPPPIYDGCVETVTAADIATPAHWLFYLPGSAEAWVLAMHRHERWRRRGFERLMRDLKGGG